MKKFICVFIFCLLFIVQAVSSNTSHGILDDINTERRRVLKSLVYQYILARYEVGENIQEVEERWGIDGIVYLLSSPPVYEEFISHQISRLENDIKKNGMTAKATIKNIETISKTDDLRWIVYLELVQSMDGVNKTIALKIKLGIKCFPLTRYIPTRKNSLINPFGCMVETYWEERFVGSDQAKENFGLYVQENPELKRFGDYYGLADCGEFAFSSEVGTCVFCAEESAAPTTSEECAKCPNRKMKGSDCILEVCGEFSFSDKEGNCHLCSTIKKINATEEECSKCGIREMKDGFCVNKVKNIAPYRT